MYQTQKDGQLRWLWACGKRSPRDSKPRPIDSDPKAQAIRSQHTVENLFTRSLGFVWAQPGLHSHILKRGILLSHLYFYQNEQ